jgi:hypothetical protein
LDDAISILSRLHQGWFELGTFITAINSEIFRLNPFEGEHYFTAACISIVLMEAVHLWARGEEVDIAIGKCGPLMRWLFALGLLTLLLRYPVTFETQFIYFQF